MGAELCQRLFLHLLKKENKKLKEKTKQKERKNRYAKLEIDEEDLYTLKHKLGNKTKASCKLGNKAMKIKVTNMLRWKERKERKNRYAKLNRGR